MAKIWPFRISMTTAAPESDVFPFARPRCTASESATSTAACKRASREVTK